MELWLWHIVNRGILGHEEVYPVTNQIYTSSLADHNTSVSYNLVSGLLQLQTDIDTESLLFTLQYSAKEWSSGCSLGSIRLTITTMWTYCVHIFSLSLCAFPNVHGFAICVLVSRETSYLPNM